MIQLCIYTYTYSFSDSFPLQDIEYSSPCNRVDLGCLSLLFIYFIYAVLCLVAQTCPTLCDLQTVA